MTSAARSFWGSLLGSRFWLLAYVMLAGGLLAGPGLSALRHAIPVLLGGVLFFACLRVELGDVRRELSAGAALVRLLALILLKLVILPISVFVVAHALAPSWSLGVLLVALMPAGVSSVAFADLHRGNTARALVILFGSSLLCPFTIPAGMLLGQSWTRGERVTIDPMALVPRVLFIAALLAVPFVLAQWVRRAARSWVDANQTKFSPVALALLAAMVFAATAATREQWLSLGFLALATPMALVFAATAVFLLCGVALSRLLSREDAVAFACSAVYMNNGLCVAFALAFFPGLPGMILPGVLMTIPMVLGISLVGRAIPPAS